MSVTKWGESVLSLLEAGGIPQAAIAKTLGLERMTLGRYLRDERRPNAETVRRINSAVARALGMPAIEAYLDIEAVEIAPLPTEKMAAGAWAALHALGAGILVDGWRETIAHWAEKQDDARVQRFVVALNRAHRKILTADLSGDIAAPQAYDSLRDILRRFGLEKAVNVSASSSAYARFRADLRAVLSQIADPLLTPAERLDAEQRIIAIALKYAPKIEQDVTMWLRPQRGEHKK